MHNIFKILTLVFFCGNIFVTHAQCPTPELYDLGLSVSSTTPIWVNCIDNVSTPDDFSLGLVSPDDITQYSIDWGDGTPLETGSGWAAGTAVSHNYTGLGEFTVTVSEIANGCTTEIEGTLINDRKPGATATPPTLNTSGCTPHTLTFVNQTTNVSPFTKYAWDWGDQSIDSVLVPSDDGESGESISHQYLPNTSDCGMQVTLTAISLCQTTFVTFGPYDFWDYDSALVNASQTQICQGEEITFSDISDYNCVTGPRNIQWDLSEVGQPITGWLPAVSANQSQTAFIDGPVGSTFTINFADSNFCGIDRNSVTVEIVAPPEAQISLGKDSICVGTQLLIDNQSTGGGSLYNWDFGDGSTLQRNNGSDEVHAFDTEGEYWIKLRAGVAGTPSCSSVDSVKVVVLKAPDLTISSSLNSSCDTTEVQFTQMHSMDASTISWNFGQGDSDVGDGPYDITYNEEGSYVVTAVTSNSSGCVRVDRDTIVIYPSPLVNFTADSVCVGDTVTFNNLSSIPFQQKNGILRELWDNLNGSSVSNLTTSNKYQNSPPDQVDILNDFEYNDLGFHKYGTRTHGYVVPPQTGFYTFWIASDDQSELWISESSDTVNLIKIASVPQFTNFRQWSKFAEQKSATIKLEANKLYYIKALHKEGSGGNHLSVGWQLPGGTLERPIKQDRLKSFSDAFLVKSIEWDFKDGTISNEEDPKHKYLTAGDRYVSLTMNTYQCSITDSVLVKVVDGVVPSFVVLDTVSCSPLTVEIYNTSQNASLFTWTLGDGKVITTDKLSDTITNVYFNNDTSTSVYNITLFANNSLGCGADVQKGVSVHPNPKAVFLVNNPTPPCAPVEVEFYNQSKQIVGDVYTWMIDKQNVSSSEDTLKYSYNNKTNKIIFDTVALAVSNRFGCKDSTTKTVTIFPEPVFKIIAPDTVCSGTVATVSIEGFANSTDWKINSSYTRSVPSFDFKFENLTATDSIFVIKLQASSVFSCGDSIEKLVVVHPSPKVELEVNSPTPPCAPIDVEFYNQSDKFLGNTFRWVIEGQLIISSEDTLRHNYTNQTSSVLFDTVSLVVRNISGCQDSTGSIVQYFPEQAFTIDAPDTVCSGTQATISINGSANSATWEINNSVTKTQSIFDFRFDNTTTKDSVFVIKLNGTSAFSCEDSVQKVVVVKPEVDAVLVVSSPTPPCSPIEVGFYNQSKDIVGNVYSWVIAGQDIISSDDTLSYGYDNKTGDVLYDTVSLVAVNKEFGCQDSTGSIVKYFPEQVFGINAPDTVCSGTQATISIDGTTNSTAWEINNSDTRIVPFFNYRFNNLTDKDSVFIIKLNGTSIFSCEDSVQKTVVVKPTLGVKMTIESPNPPCSPIDVAFYNQSERVFGDIYSWVIAGQDIISSDDTLRHAYENKTGDVLYDTVSLVVKDEFGCQDSTGNVVRVFPEQVFGINVPDTVCSGTEVTVSIDGSDDITTEWRINDKVSRVTPSFNFRFDNPGLKDSVYIIKLNGTSVFSCEDSVQAQVVVKAPLKAVFSLTPTEQIFPATTVGIQNSSTGDIDTYSWDFGDGKVDSVRSPIDHMYGYADTFYVKLNVANAYCVDSTTRQTTISLPLPEAKFSGTDTACAPHAVTFTNLSVNSLRYRWDFGDGGSSTDENPTHTYLQAGTYSVKLVAINNSGADSVVNSEIIYVVKQPVAFFTTTPNVGSEEVIAPAEFYFKNQSLNATSYQWNFDNNGDGSNQRDVNYVYNNEGVYEPTLIATNKIGCTDTFTLFPAIHVVESGKLYVPNVFNPNAQLTTNQVFKPVILGTVDKYQMVVYNRWGEALFTSNDIDVGWDGDYLGRHAELGVYVYVIEVTFTAGNTEKFVGDITLIR